MSETATATTYVNEVDEITKVMQACIDGARTGKGAAMKPAFDDSVMAAAAERSRITSSFRSPLMSATPTTQTLPDAALVGGGGSTQNRRLGTLSAACECVTIPS